MNWFPTREAGTVAPTTNRNCRLTLSRIETKLNMFYNAQTLNFMFIPQNILNLLQF